MTLPITVGQSMFLSEDHSLVVHLEEELRYSPSSRFVTLDPLVDRMVPDLADMAALDT